MFFSVFFCTVRLSIFERFVFASFEPLRFCKKVRFVFPDLRLRHIPVSVVHRRRKIRFVEREQSIAIPA